MLRTCGENRVHLSAFDLVVEQRDGHVPLPVPELSPERIEVTEVVGAYVSTLVNDGDTIQIGTGTLSSTMGGYLVEKNDLGIDSEILVASAVELVKRGVATGRYKTYRPGRGHRLVHRAGRRLRLLRREPAHRAARRSSG